MAISPWYVGQTLPVAVLTLTYDNGNPVDLTGWSSIALNFVNRSDGNSYVGAGSVAVPLPGTGAIHYTWAAADVTTEGTYSIKPVVMFSTGELRCDPIPWVLLP